MTDPEVYWTNDVYPIDLVAKADYDMLRHKLRTLVNFVEGCEWEHDLPSAVSLIIQEGPYK